MAGIYMIICDHTGAFYIGGTRTSFAARFASHHSALRGGYAVPLLQRAWDALGEQEHWFRFVPLYECPPEEVRAREIEAIRTLKPALNHRQPTVDTTLIAAELGMDPASIRYRKRKGLPLDKPKGLRSIVKGEELTLRDIAEKHGVPLQRVRERYSRGVRGDELIRAAGARR